MIDTSTHSATTARFHQKIFDFNWKWCKIIINNIILTADIESNRFRYSKLLESDFKLSMIRFGMANHLSLHSFTESSHLFFCLVTVSLSSPCLSVKSLLLSAKRCIALLLALINYPKHLKNVSVLFIQKQMQITMIVFLQGPSICIRNHFSWKIQQFNHCSSK